MNKQAGINPNDDQLEATMDVGTISPDTVSTQRVIIDDESSLAAVPEPIKDDPATTQSKIGEIVDALDSLGNGHNPESTDQFHLSELLANKDWERLEPNFPNPHHLLPREMTLSQLQGILGHIEGITSARNLSQGTDVAFPDGGTLKKIGEGESKTALLYTTAEGKQMVVHIQNGYNLGLTIPKDTRISLGYSLQNDFGHRELHGYYSDARTYAQIPLSQRIDYGVGVTLQEYLGTSTENEGFVDKVKNRGRTKEAERRAVEHIRQQGWQIEDRQEFDLRRNYFAPSGANGPRAIIDIPITRISS